MPTRHTSDPYATLGVPRGATAREIRAAYRRLAKRYHPDLHRDAGATDQMRRVNQAWETLSSPSRRAEYDARVTPGGGGATAGHWAAAPRRAPGGSSAPPWASYGSGPLYGDVRSSRPHPAAGVYGASELRSGPSPLTWAGLALLVPIVAVLGAVVSGGLLSFPLLGILALVFAGRLFGRDG